MHRLRAAGKTSSEEKPQERLKVKSEPWRRTNRCRVMYRGANMYHTMCSTLCGVWYAMLCIASCA
eukprot:13161990-Heterocapsa_arctica.AAC.1